MAAILSCIPKVKTFSEWLPKWPGESRAPCSAYSLGFQAGLGLKIIGFFKSLRFLVAAHLEMTKFKPGSQ